MAVAWWNEMITSEASEPSGEGAVDSNVGFIQDIGGGGGGHHFDEISKFWSDFGASCE